MCFLGNDLIPGLSVDDMDLNEVLRRVCRRSGPVSFFVLWTMYQAAQAYPTTVLPVAAALLRNLCEKQFWVSVSDGSCAIMRAVCVPGVQDFPLVSGFLLTTSTAMLSLNFTRLAIQNEPGYGEDLWRGFVQFVDLTAELGKLGTICAAVVELPSDRFSQLTDVLEVHPSVQQSSFCSVLMVSGILL